MAEVQNESFTATYEQLPAIRNPNFFYILTSKSVVKNSVLPTAAIISIVSLFWGHPVYTGCIKKRRPLEIKHIVKI